MPLQLGANEYHRPDGALGFDGNIDVQPIRTLLRGICYKLTFSDPLTLDMYNSNSLVLFVSSYNDDLKKIQLMIAEKNTWQGIVLPKGFK